MEKKTENLDMTVPLDSYKDNPIPRVNNNVDPREVNSFGPKPVGAEHDYSTVGKKEPIVGLFLGPGLYRTARHIQVIEFLIQNKINIRLIAGSGLGAVVASLYANGVTPNEIEWMFFKFYSKSHNLKPFSVNWINLVDEIFLDKLKSTRIESLGISTLVPVYSLKKKSVEIIKRGRLRKTLLSNLVLNSTKSNLFKPGYMSSVSRFWDIKQHFKKAGADIIIGVDVVGKEEVKLKEANDFLVGVLGRAISNQERLYQELDLSVALKSFNLPLDETRNLPRQIPGDEEQLNILLEKYKMVYNKWKSAE